MSSFRATLELGGKEYDVLYSNYEFSRTTDKKGQPASSISGGRISVTIESTDDTSTIEAMLNSQFKPVEGKIVYKKSEEDAKMKEISFKNAYIVHYKETLDVNNEAPMTIAMTFSAEISPWVMQSSTTVGLAHKLRKIKGLCRAAMLSIVLFAFNTQRGLKSVLYCSYRLSPKTKDIIPQHAY